MAIISTNVWYCAVVFAFVAFFSGSLVQGDVVKTERDLRQHLFSDYDKQARPVRRASTQVTVAMSVTPISLISMNEKDQIIVLDTLVITKWKDEYLQWDPSEYDNITQIRVSSNEIWKPDLALYTGTPDISLFPVIQTQAIAYNTGMMVWVPPFTMKSRCPLPFRNYDTTRSFVECNIRIGSWTYSGPLMDIQLSTEKVDLTDFQDVNPEWKLVKVVSNRESKYYPCCVEEYPSVNFNFTLKRRNYYFKGT